MRLEASKGTVTVVDRGGYQSRNAATIHLIIDALKTLTPSIKRNQTLHFWTTDFPPGNLSGTHLAYCKSNQQANIHLIPDFSFWFWPEVGISDYSQLISQMVNASKTPPVHDQLFWAGNPGVHPTRQKLFEIAAGKPDFHVRSIQWNPGARPEYLASDQAMQTAANNYVSLPDHCQYKYLIDLQGIGYSARLKVLLFSRRLLFIQDRPWREFFFDELAPYKHFIPVKESLADLEDRLHWAKTHEAECDAIARQAQEFALAKLTREAAVLHLRKTFESLLNS